MPSGQPLSQLIDRLQRDIGLLSGRLLQSPPRDRELLGSLIDSLSRQLVPIRQHLASSLRGSVSDLPGVSSREITSIRSSIQRWGEVRELLLAILSEPRWPLLAPEPAKNSLQRAHTELSDDMFVLLHTALSDSEQSNVAYREGAFADIGLNNSLFVALLHAAYRIRLGLGARYTRFLDVGCGIGIKLLCASWFFNEVTGVEFDAGYVKSGSQLIERTGVSAIRLLQKDAFDFENYDQFDVIYMFRPLSDPDRMRSLEVKIVSEATPNTILVCPYRDFEMRHDDYHCSQLAKGLFITGMDRKSAAELLNRVQYIGLTVQPFRAPIHDLWEPISDAAAALGFGPERPSRLEGI